MAREGSNNREARQQETLSRGTAACNACRAKKQKCGGERPVCLRCLNNKQECKWAQRQKRGPTKGYTDALETRLQDTENILLAILSTISVADLPTILTQSFQLCSASQRGLPDNPSGLATTSKSAIIQGKAAVEYWDKFALTTPAGVASWHRDRVARGDEHQLCTNKRLQDVAMNPDDSPGIPVSNGGRYIEAAPRQDFAEDEQYQHPNDSVERRKPVSQQDSPQFEPNPDPRRFVEEGETAAQQNHGSQYHHLDDSVGDNAINNDTTAPSPFYQYADTPWSTGQGGRLNKQNQEQHVAGGHIDAPAVNAGGRGLGLSLEFQQAYLW